MKEEGTKLQQQLPTSEAERERVQSRLSSMQKDHQTQVGGMQVAMYEKDLQMQTFSQAEHGYKESIKDLSSQIKSVNYTLSLERPQHEDQVVRVREDTGRRNHQSFVKAVEDLNAKHDGT